MGRKAIFDKEEVSQILLQTFWENGADVTSTRMLQDATGMNPGSLYHAFGNLEEMFVHAIDFYNRTVVEERINKYLLHRSPDIKKFLWSAIRPVVTHPQKTCFHVHSGASKIGQTKLAKAAIKTGFDKITNGLISALYGYGFTKIQATALSKRLLIFYEGLLLSSLILNDKKLLKQTIDIEIEKILEGGCN